MAEPLLQNTFYKLLYFCLLYVPKFCGNKKQITIGSMWSES